MSPINYPIPDLIKMDLQSTKAVNGLLVLFIGVGPLKVSGISDFLTKGGMKNEIPQMLSL